ncbi:MAG: FAD-dependent oxidoreductase [Acidobacteria bacterium]|nr:FAD-dependent oxidoreductase [Acidobacteriota bacterium]
MAARPDVIVVGAGILGAWIAFFLRRHGARTLLLDAWEPGHLRATSSDESRVLRCGYGPRRLYTRWAWEALALWKHWQQEWGARLLHRVGVLWMHERENEFTAASLAALREEKIPIDQLPPDELTRRFPQISPAGVGLAYLEPEAGALSARRAVRTVVKGFVAAGGEFQLGRAAPPAEGSGRGSQLEEIRLIDGSRLSAGCFVFACGPWLPQLFPGELGGFIRVTRQEVFYFGTPPGDARFNASHMPAWLMGNYYGIPALDGRGFKIAEDEVGPPFDPDAGDRVASEAVAQRVRQQLALRFPAMKGAPLLEARVCQYESTPDGHLLLDRHPAWENVWLVGGGSGHSFKLGPKVGSVAAVAATDASTPLPPELKLQPRTSSDGRPTLTD